MNTIAKHSRPAYDQLRNLDAKSWTKAYFTTTSKADNVENNMSECFNAWIISERKNKCPNPPTRGETSKDKGKSKENTTADKPKRTYKPKRKACTPWRTNNKASEASELNTVPSQRKKLEIRRKPALHTQASMSSCMTTNKSIDGGKYGTIREENAENLAQDF
ncbi:hypothetical protein AgCh_031873 [Apium graveolens]